jgi:hypothetical protein
MSCCGKMRRQPGVTFNPERPQHTGSRLPARSPDRFAMGTIFFEYIGVTAITAVGAVTGRQYRFAIPGVPVATDLRDRWSLLKVPNLREIHGHL